MNIFIGNLAKETTNQELQNKFSPFGTIDSCKIVIDMISGESRGYGFVDMPDSSNGIAAINGLNNISLNGKNLSVHEARPKKINRRT